MDPPAWPKSTMPTSMGSGANVNVFVDTSAFLAIKNRRDALHKEALTLKQQVLDMGKALVTSDYVLDESVLGDDGDFLCLSEVTHEIDFRPSEAEVTGCRAGVSGSAESREARCRGPEDRWKTRGNGDMEKGSGGSQEYPAR